VRGSVSKVVGTGSDRERERATATHFFLSFFF